MVVLAIAATSVFSLADHGVSLVGVLPKGFPPLTIPHVGLADLGLLVRRGAGHRAGLARRHDLHRVGVRGPHRAAGRRQRRDDRDRRGEPGRRALPGLPGQHQRVTDRGGRALGCEDAADRGHRRGPDHRDDRADPGPVPQPAPARTGRRGDHRVAVPGRHPGHGAAVAAAQDRVRAVDHGVRSASRLLGVLPGIAIAVALSILQRLPAGVVALRHASSGGRKGWTATTTCAPTRRPSSCPAW